MGVRDLSGLNISLKMCISECVNLVFEIPPNKTSSE